MKHRRITRKRRVLAVGAMSVLALGALSVAASAGAAEASPGTISQSHTALSVLGGPLVKSETGRSWAGYVAEGGKHPFTYVEAEFRVAAVNCRVTPHLSQASQWVGLDGSISHTVEQIGVESDCGNDPHLPKNAPHYFAWWEMYKPNDPKEAPTEIEPVNAGDIIVATVYQIPAGSPGDALEYVLSLQDLTKSGVPKSFLKPCPKGFECKDASAEVISEGYNSKPWKGPADFGRETFSDISLGEYGDLIGNFATTIWTNIKETQKQKKVDAVPTALSHGGTEFSVVWHSDK